MNLPNQAEPVERIIITATVGSEHGNVAHGVEASGIDANGWFDDIVRTVAPIAVPLAQQALGSII